ncbi:MAG: carotenoid 1,2-hydratase [Chloroflexi bacterium]|nr:carotenoid 1,2-hydratase [Chloroflexota bacterium]
MSAIRPLRGSGWWQCRSSRGVQQSARRPAHLLLSGAVIGLVLLLAGCDLQPSTDPLPPAPAPTPVVYAPVTFPRDEAPHQDLTEWWYYTGHLEAADGRRWGFEYVTFQALRGTLPPLYLSHFAVTDHQQRHFQYDQRLSQGAQEQPPEGFSLQLGDWAMSGQLGQDQLRATMANYAVDLALSTDRPPVLHEGGLVSFGPAGDSYYYSRTRMEIRGTLVDHGEQIPVTGLAWFDKQWGNFLVMGGGWDWFSLQLDDGSDVMLNLIKDAEGVIRIAYGTYVSPNGDAHHIGGDRFEVSVLDHWTSPHTGATYPAGWHAQVRDPAIDLTIQPVLPDQELDTRGTTNVIYWEGENTASGTLNGQPVTGRGYVELVGYGSAPPR